MEITHLLLLLSAGLAAGFVAGLIGVGGGIIFAPVLFFYYQSIGIAPEIIAPLTIGSSLFCTLLAAIASAWTQYGRQAVLTNVAVTVGLFSALVIFLMTRYVTTQPWYDGTVFQVVFGFVLLTVVGRMVIRRRTKLGVPTLPQPDGAASRSADTDERQTRIASRHERSEVNEAERTKNGARSKSWPALASAGTVAGAVSAAAGVGGGVVLVPAYNHFMGLPIHVATGTSSATIVLIALVGVLNYALQGLGETDVFGAVGYVDAVRAMVLAVPSLVTANLGVRVAHRINQRALRLSFAAIAAIVAVRLLLEALV